MWAIYCRSCKSSWWADSRPTTCECGSRDLVSTEEIIVEIEIPAPTDSSDESEED